MCIKRPTYRVQIFWKYRVRREKLWTERARDRRKQKIERNFNKKKREKEIPIKRKSKKE